MRWPRTVPVSLQDPRTGRGPQRAAAVLVVRIGPGQMLDGPPLRIPRDLSDGRRLEDGLTQRGFGIGMHAAVFRKARHDRGAVERAEASLEAAEMQHGRIGIAEKHLRIPGDHVQVDMRDQADRIVAADAGDDPLDRGIGESRVDVVGPRCGITAEPSGVAERMGHRDGLEPEGLGEVSPAGLVAMRKDGRPAPARRDDGDAISGLKRPRLDERLLPPALHDIPHQTNSAQ